MNLSNPSNFSYVNVDIQDFTRSWQNGLGFNALIHRYRPDLFNYEERLTVSASENLEHAFSVAQKVFRIDRYLDVEGLLMNVEITIERNIFKFLFFRCSRRIS